MVKRLLLCIPNQSVHYRGMNARPQVSIPLGILSIVAFLRENGWAGDVRVYDARLSASFTTTQEKGGRVTLFGDDEATMGKRIAEIAPDVIGISNMFSAQFPQALRMAEVAKQACPNAVVVMGGPHVSVFPEETLEQPCVDYVVVGEGEERMLALLRCLEAGETPAIPGVLGRPEDRRLLRDHPLVKVNFIKEVDDLPLPAYDMVDVERYFELQANGFSPRTREWGQRAVTMITSRGCPHRCTFCSIHATMGYRWRAHSPDYIRRHIALLRERYAIDFIHFEDDNLTHDSERYDRLLNILLELLPRLPWDTPNGVRGDGWTLERVRRTRESGCQYLAVAIESAVQNVLDKVVRKRLDLAQVDNLMVFTHQEGLRLMAFYVVGLPGERLEDIDATFRYALARYFRFGVWPGMNLAVALPGTELGRIVERDGLRDPSLPYAANQLTTSEFSPADIQKRFRRFQRLKILIFLWRSLTSWRDLRYNASLVWRYRSSIANEFRKAFGM
ncbi:B12-binding domain-containing radical SAM protein [Magnetospirillum gryphiswaldense]|uniref:B12-binding domain-containing radical SAM protein n=1 Tax=Magnetospirillum gryphiswaldense TaxID=55518 RepID=UPI0009FFB26C|nr:cobalamin-dependent protein [Magnetospirillum gryphiswaldense]